MAVVSSLALLSARCWPARPDGESMSACMPARLPAPAARARRSSTSAAEASALAAAACSGVVANSTSGKTAAAHDVRMSVVWLRNRDDDACGGMSPGCARKGGHHTARVSAVAARDTVVMRRGQMAAAFPIRARGGGGPFARTQPPRPAHRWRHRTNYRRRRAGAEHACVCDPCEGIAPLGSRAFTSWRTRRSAQAARRPWRRSEVTAHAHVCERADTPPARCRRSVDDGAELRHHAPRSPALCPAALRGRGRARVCLTRLPGGVHDDEVLVRRRSRRSACNERRQQHARRVTAAWTTRPPQRPHERGSLGGRGAAPDGHPGGGAPLAMEARGRSQGDGAARRVHAAAASSTGAATALAARGTHPQRRAAAADDDKRRLVGAVEL
jgi:hypothetical protein